MTSEDVEKVREAIDKLAYIALARAENANDRNDARRAKEAALALLSEPAPATDAKGAEGWRPIESAPKIHGQEILVCEVMPRGMRTCAVVEWLSSDVVDDDGFTSGWYISDGHNDPIWYRNWPSLTHWQPLPEAPK